MKCRCCGGDITGNPLIKLTNMPQAAQGFPTKETLSFDQGTALVLYECPQCGVVQLDGAPVPYYMDVIRATNVSREMKEFRQQQFSCWMKEYDLREKKIIEIGCGHGEYLTLLKENCPAAVGLEHSDVSVTMCKKKNLTVYEGYVDSTSFTIPNAPYDAFCIFNFFEHVPYPRNFLAGIVNNLSETAVGLIEVPNFDMILKECMYTELIQDHLLYFTQDTLCRFLESNGFIVLRCQSIWHDYILSVEVKRRKKLNLFRFYSKREVMLQNTATFFAEHKTSRIAVWGAGHQALATIALLHMNKYVEMVIDSAPFKQNKFTPATHLPIYAPSVLKTAFIDIVLIIAGSYTQEIAAYLCKNHPRIKVYKIDNEGKIITAKGE